MNNDEKRDEKNDEGKGVSNLVFYGAIIGGLLLFITILSMDSPKVPKTTHGNASSSYSASTLADIKVTTSMEQRGEYVVITTMFRNEKDYPTKQGMDVSILDSTNQKHFVDKVYVELDAKESGRAESSAKIGDLGPPPYKVVTDWK